jgi:hypothetical protein
LRSVSWVLNSPLLPQTRTLEAAALQKATGTVVQANTTSVDSALADYLATGSTDYNFMLLGRPFHVQ